MSLSDASTLLHDCWDPVIFFLLHSVINGKMTKLILPDTEAKIRTVSIVEKNLHFYRNKDFNHYNILMMLICTCEMY